MWYTYGYCRRSRHIQFNTKHDLVRPFVVPATSVRCSSWKDTLLRPCSSNAQQWAAPCPLGLAFYACNRLFAAQPLWTLNTRRGWKSLRGKSTRHNLKTQETDHRLRLHYSLACSLARLYIRAWWSEECEWASQLYFWQDKRRSYNLRLEKCCMKQMKTQGVNGVVNHEKFYYWNLVLITWVLVTCRV